MLLKQYRGGDGAMETKQEGEDGPESETPQQAGEEAAEEGGGMDK